jgi:mono/diheme cytochrome c family protein
MIFGFDMAMGVRHSDKALAARLDSVIDKDRAEILGILRDYNVPLLDVRTSSSLAPAGQVLATYVSLPARAAPPDSMLVSDAAYQGWKWFHVYCYRCHGVDAFGGQLAPDLRHSLGPDGAVTHDVFIRTVTDGRTTKGMPSWKTLLDSTQIEELYAYVKLRSDGTLPPRRPHRASDLPKP